MKKRQLQIQKQLEDVYQSISRTLNALSLKADVESLSNSYPYFYFTYERLVFTKEPVKYSKETKLITYNHGDLSVSLHYTYHEGVRSVSSKNIRVYKKIFPFLTFTKVDALGWVTDCCDTSILYKILPSRKKIIDEILKEL